MTKTKVRGKRPKKEILPEQEKYIRENYKSTGDYKLSEALTELGMPATACKVKLWRQELGLTDRPTRQIDDTPEYSFCWKRAVQKDFIFGNIQDNYKK